MRDIMKTMIPLFIICLVTGFCLSYVNNVTKGPIQQRIDEDTKARKAAVMAAAQSFEPVTLDAAKGIIISADKGIADGKTVGYVFVAEPKGYGGAMNVTVGVGADGKVTGVKLGDNKETPGLGTKAGEDFFIGQFTGKTISERIDLVKKAPSGNQIQAITGATISSRAVTSAVQAAADAAAVLIAKESSAQ